MLMARSHERERRQRAVQPRFGHAGQSYPRPVLVRRSLADRIRHPAFVCSRRLAVDDQHRHRRWFGFGCLSDRAFIQLAGFTFGKTQSFFDVPDIADMTYHNEFTRQNFSGTGTPVFAYTATLGNGVSATLSIEAIPSAVRLLSICGRAPRSRSVRLTPPTTTATKCRTSSVICASTRLGALPRSPALCISTRLNTSAPLPLRPASKAIQTTSGAGLLAPASC